jgi:Lrp/AsnC family transcriptional regulator for asnA, asnC and gidA
LKSADGQRQLSAGGHRVAASARALDDVDSKIIGLLQRDGRMPYVRIGRDVGLSEGAARKRVQRLLAIGAMQVVAIADPAWRANEVVALIGILTSSTAGAVAERLAAVDETRCVMTTAGTFDVVAEVGCDNPAHLLRILDDQVRRIPGVARVEALLCLAVHKSRA